MTEIQNVESYYKNKTATFTFKDEDEFKVKKFEINSDDLIENKFSSIIKANAKSPALYSYLIIKLGNLKESQNKNLKTLQKSSLLKKKILNYFLFLFIIETSIYLFISFKEIKILQNIIIFGYSSFPLRIFAFLIYFKFRGKRIMKPILKDFKNSLSKLNHKASTFLVETKVYSPHEEILCIKVKVKERPKCESDNSAFSKASSISLEKINIEDYSNNKK